MGGPVSYAAGAEADRAVEREIDHEDRVAPLDPFRLRGDLGPDHLGAEQRHDELARVDARRDQAPGHDLLAARQPDAGGAPIFNGDPLDPGAGPDLAAA